MVSVCRGCLATNSRLYSLKNNLLLKDVYEKLSNTKFNSEDAMHRVFCSFCCQKLLRCCSFSQMVYRSEKIIDYLHERGLEVTEEYISKVNAGMKQHLSVTTLPFIAINGNKRKSGTTAADSQTTINHEVIFTHDIKKEVNTEQDKLMENESVPKLCTKSIKLEDDSGQGNEVRREEVTTKQDKLIKVEPNPEECTKSPELEDASDERNEVKELPSNSLIDTEQDKFMEHESVPKVCTKSIKLEYDSDQGDEVRIEEVTTERDKLMEVESVPEQWTTHLKLEDASDKGNEVKELPSNSLVDTEQDKFMDNESVPKVCTNSIQLEYDSDQGDEVRIEEVTTERDKLMEVESVPEQWAISLKLEDASDKGNEVKELPSNSFVEQIKEDDPKVHMTIEQTKEDDMTKLHMTKSFDCKDEEAFLGAEAEAETLALDSGSEVDGDEGLTAEELQELLEEDEDYPEEERTPSSKFMWSDDFSTFQGRRETFREEVGPKIDSIDPVVIFTQFWDQPLMNVIVSETNKYAQQTIDAAVERDTLPPAGSRIHGWAETSVDEIYRLIGVMMLMGMCVRGHIDEYWSTGVLGMSQFRKLMTIKRFWLLMKFIHFVDNDTILPGENKKPFKIEPLLEYLNSKFQNLYSPRQELSIDESLLLWKDRLSWFQCIQTKAARFRIKTYELCEAITGYCLKIQMYSGKSPNSAQPLFGFTGTGKIVVNMFIDYLGKGYTLFMDDFYNSACLTRFLKSKKTDVVGILNRRRGDTPACIKNLEEKRVGRGDMISRHCGDVAVVAWKDVRLVTTVSTYHNNTTLPGQRAGRNVDKPIVVHEYNKFMSGVDLKDQKLSMYLMERKRGIKWYIKVFRRLINITILNSYVIYCANVANTGQTKMSHRQFLYKLASQLGELYGHNTDQRQRRPPDAALAHVRLDPSLGHYPDKKEKEGDRASNKIEKAKRNRCARCAAKGVRRTTTLVCSRCDVFLCVGGCWREYHTLENMQ